MLQTRRPALSGNALKGIAILAMTLDHLTWTLWPGYATDWWVLVCHVLGRVTAPIMWFFIVEGYHYTHDVKKYAARLFALALISHFAYDFCFVCDLRGHVPVGLELRGRDGDLVHGAGARGLTKADGLAHGVVGRVRARVFLLYR